jgi:pimeloyl-ACP methyl ester carboxylesterase
MSTGARQSSGVPGERQKVHFNSGGTRCAAWFYPGSNGSCLVMTGGLAVTKEPAADRFAARFQAAGFSVLAFDYRRIGESEGTPRQVLPIKDQHEDWRAATAYAATLPGVDRGRVAAWAFSLSAGHLLQLAGTGRLDVAAVIAQMPYVGGVRASLALLRHQSLGAVVGLFARGLLDAAGGVLGRRPRLIPLAAPRGSVALLSTPDGLRGNEALNPDNRYPDWEQSVAARSTLAAAAYRPGAVVGKIELPVLFVVCEDDLTTLASSTMAVAPRARRGEVLVVPGGHYAPFLEAHEDVVAAELDFLDRHLGRSAKPLGDAADVVKLRAEH